MGSVFHVFPCEPRAPTVERLDGPYVITTDGRRLLDATAGSTSFSILGGSDAEVLAKMRAQLDRFCHVDYKAWTDPNVERLAELLLSRAEHALDRVYFAGNSGAEACEAAMKMSYQVHHDLGRKDKRWFISRTQSYHGATSDALALGERPNLEFYRPMLSPYRAMIPMHHPLYRQATGETPVQYARRSAAELEAKILDIGAEKVCGFVAETMMGGLVGDVPPAPGYWRAIREVCDRHQVHLILDEVYCGTGTSGKIYCIDHDGVTPDFLFIGKTLAAGYAPLSAVLTSRAVEEVIRSGQRRLQHTTTHQAYSLGVAAALAVQRRIHDDLFLERVRTVGERMRAVLQDELGNHPFFRDIRGRGMRFSLEYDCADKNEFGTMLQRRIEERHSILINAKWHRICFTPALTVTDAEVDRILNATITEFRALAAEWRIAASVAR